MFLGLAGLSGAGVLEVGRPSPVTGPRLDGSMGTLGPGPLDVPGCG